MSVFILSCGSSNQTDYDKIHSDIYIEIGTLSRLQEQGYLEKNQKKAEEDPIGANDLKGVITVKVGSEVIGKVSYSGISIWFNKFAKSGDEIEVTGTVGRDIYIAVAKMNVSANEIKEVLLVKLIGDGEISYSLSKKDVAKLLDKN
jgi:hypothetical protein